MSSDGHHIGVMTGKAWAFGVFLVAVLPVCVCSGYSLEEDCRYYIEGNILPDHYLMIKNFTAPGEKVKEEHTFLSIIVMMCSSLKENKDFYITYVQADSDHFEKVIWLYMETLRNWSNREHRLDDVLKFCENYNCSHSYDTSYITPKQFCNMFENVNKTTPLPECPKPISLSIPTMHTSTSSSSTSTTSTSTSTTSTSTQSSDSYTTTPAVSEYLSTPAPTSTTITHSTTSEDVISSTGIKEPEKHSTEQGKDLPSLLPFLFLVASLLLNFILGWHCMKRKKWRLFTNPLQEQSDTQRDSCEHHVNKAVIKDEESSLQGRTRICEVQLELDEESII